MAGTVDITVQDSTSGQQSSVKGSANAIWAIRASDYPTGATPVTSSSGDKANAAATGTLAGVAGKTTYISGFQITSSGSTAAAVVNPTVAGVTGGTMTYTYVTAAGATVANQSLVVSFNPPVPASAVNTSIVVTLPALGAGSTSANVVAYGYQL